MAGLRYVSVKMQCFHGFTQQFIDNLILKQIVVPKIKQYLLLYLQTQQGILQFEALYTLGIIQKSVTKRKEKERKWKTSYVWNYTIKYEN